MTDGPAFVRRRPGGQSQFSNCLVKGSGARRDFRELQDWIIGHPCEDLSVEALARRMNMSPRHFARIFDREVGLTPAKFVELVRLKKTRGQLEVTYPVPFGGKSVSG
jgi:transcriptional regulator GlxA family with amidase domain